jgi:hypothetical protein
MRPHRVRIGFDFDGVLCPTPFGRFAVRAPSPVADLPPGYERYYASEHGANPLRLAVEYARFGWRGSSREAIAVARELAASHEVHIVTGRSVAGEPVVRRWLRRHGLEDVFADVWMAPEGLRPPQHKLAVALMQGMEAHIDDDPRTAHHLARSGVPHVFLFDPSGAQAAEARLSALTVVRSLREVPLALSVDTPR